MITGCECFCLVEDIFQRICSIPISVLYHDLKRIGELIDECLIVVSEGHNVIVCLNLVDRA